MSNKIVVIRIRGDCGLDKTRKESLRRLRLFKKNSCIVLTNAKNLPGILFKLKDQVTWGEIDEPTFKTLLEKRGKLPGNKKLTEDYLKEKTKLDIVSFSKEFFGGKKTLKDIPGLKLYFRLSPPVSGFERKGVKKPFSQGGVTGYRKEKINDLIKRMI
ncbi:MAG: 50S ribosomal protein L30 [Nanoarchaeota archaeon]|nr:50S ribosomal protein L30 [Nanoarchaeota archaeon]MBU1445030.1 50S ribosomal protein L30 [Nanoarchaeota archaeon]MBU2406870.1 50S ribosomal protein L30 [Nanoarchaeota archaeon]MBU2420040.1 50S ribosomal protein L30 [Nanoarchaeota archaeon]MBU2475480.1 50S ribosomal protein L30 [Nanoarchaeota archaeon]